MPKSFTAEQITSAVEIKTFTLAKIRATIVYIDESLSNPLTTLEKNSTVRLFSIKDGIATIEYFNGETYVKGFVSESDLINEPNLAIRNILIVLAVITCACGSITFFIIRTKNKN